MSISVAIVICGWAYAAACRLSPNVTDWGIKNSQGIAARTTLLGLLVEYASITWGAC